MDTLSAPRRYSVLAAHEARPRLCLPAIVVALFSLLVVGGSAARAQEGTPAAGLDAPTAAECTVAPRSEDEMRALFREAAATPVLDSPEIAASPTPAIAPTGDPADEQTVAEVSATWRQFIACITAGDQTRMFALFSDDMVRRQFVVDIAFGVTEDALFEFLAATPVPLPPDQSIPIPPFDDVRVLSDGRVAVVGPGDQGRGDVRIFVKEGDRWLLDEWFDLTPSGTPAAGMPITESTPDGWPSNTPEPRASCALEPLMLCPTKCSLDEPMTVSVWVFMPSSRGDLGGLPRHAGFRAARARPEAELSRFAAGKSR